MSEPLAPTTHRDRIRARVLHSTAAAVFTVTGAYLAMILVLNVGSPGVPDSVRTMRLVIAATMFTLGGGAMLLVRRGHTRLGAALLLGGIYLGMVGSAVYLQLGIAATGLTLLGPLVLMSGFLIQPAAARNWSIAICMTLLALYAGQQLGVIAGPTAATRPTPGLMLVIYTMTTLLIGWLTYNYAHIFEELIREETTARLAESATALELRAILEAAPDCIKVLAADETVLQMNAAGLAMIEADRPDQVIGKPVLGLIVPEHRAAFSALNRRVLGGEEGRMEYEVLGFKGGRRWLRTHAVPLRDAADTITAILAVTDDISGRKQVEDELRASEQRQALFIRHAPAAIAMFDNRIRYLAASDRWIANEGLQGQAIAGRSPWDFYPNYPRTFNEVHQRVLAGSPEERGEDSFPGSDGLPRTVRWEVRPWHAADGTIGGIVVFYDDITDRKRAEDALRTSEQRLRVFISDAPVSIAMFDREMRFIAASQRWLDDIHLRREDAIGRCLYDVVPNIAPHWRAIHDRNLAGETLSSEEESHRLEDGTVIWFRWSQRPWYEASGEIGGVLSFTETISERKRAEDALRASEERLALFIRHAPVSIAMFDREMRYLAHSRRWLEDFRIDSADLVGQSHYDVIPDMPLRTHEIYDRCLAGETLRNDADPFPRADGSTQWLRWESLPWRAADGSIGGVLIVVENITERRRDEQALMESQRRQAQLIANIDGIVWEADPATFDFTFVSAQAERLLGYPVRDWLAERGFWARHIHPDDRDAAVRYCAECTAAKRDHQLSYRMIAADGRVVWMQDVARLVEEEGRPPRLRGLMVDITELRRTQDALKAANVALEERTAAAEAANEAKSKFLATMSHEIRTPLNGILGMAQLMLGTDDVSREEQQRYARTILNAGTTLLAVLNDVLDLSKIEAGKMEIVPVSFDVGQLIEEVAALMRDAASAKGLALTATLAEGMGTAFVGDAVRIRQMLTNLVSNAIKFTESGGVRIVASAPTQHGATATRGLRFAVADTGIGIAADKLGQLFRPFSQLDASYTRQFGGTGLGLSIVRALAESMGGHAGVESELGRGSCFWFELPLSPDSALDHRGAARDTGEVALAATPQRKPRVLQVEDHPINRFVVESLLRKKGVEVINAENGQEAVDMLCGDAPRPDAVLMDLQMPVMDGIEATRRIRAHEAAHGLPRLPVIALTANAFEQDRQASFAAGMDDFIVKPVDARQLLATLARWLAVESP